MKMHTDGTIEGSPAEIVEYQKLQQRNKTDEAIYMLNKFGLPIAGYVIVSKEG